MCGAPRKGTAAGNGGSSAHDVLSQLRELLGGALEDPEERLALSLALRAQ